LYHLEQKLKCDVNESTNTNRARFGPDPSAILKWGDWNRVIEKGQKSVLGG